MEATLSSANLEQTYYSTRCSNPERHNLLDIRRRILKNYFSVKLIVFGLCVHISSRQWKEHYWLILGAKIGK